MRLFLALVLCLQAAAAPPARAAEPPAILGVGDSLSAGFGLAPGQGWVALLQQRLKKQVLELRLERVANLENSVQQLAHLMD